jgi:homoserine kinase type II
MIDLIRKVSGHYDLGELRTAQRVGRGFVNENWILETTSGRYFLKRRHPDLRNPTIVCAQHALNKHLRQSGFPAPAILPSKSGETLLVLNSEYFEIQEYIEGSPYQDTNEAHFQAAALTLGFYHACIHGFTPHPHCDLGALYSPPIVDDNLTSLTDLLELERDPALIPVLQQLESHAADLALHFSKHHELPCLFIHGDYHVGNLLFQGDRIVGVVDYDKACWQPRVVELAEALIHFAAPCPGHFKHLVYPGFLDWDKFATFLRYYSYGVGLDEEDPIRLAWIPQLDTGKERVVSCKDIFLSEKEACALPDYIRCIWLSVSLKRLMEKESKPAAVSEELRELLDLADWSAVNGQQMIETICAVLETATGPNLEE